MNGMFKTRNFVEGCVMGGVIALLAWMGIDAAFEVKISLVIGLAAPFMMLGISGVNGDPLSTFLVHALDWLKTRGTKLYNGEARALAQSPLKYMMEEEGMNDKIINAIESVKERSREKRGNAPMVEGRDFKFAVDKDLVGKYIDENMDDEDDYDDDEPPEVKKPKRVRTRRKAPAKVEEDDDDEIIEANVVVESPEPIISVSHKDSGSVDELGGEDFFAQKPEPEQKEKPDASDSGWMLLDDDDDL